MNIIQAVPTNIITGFLGVGKTTAINHLLASKPTEERWAVLINEFGEIGVDASLLGQQTEKNIKSGIFIKEVAGGCMCCTSGLPMQVTLNCLLSEARPHRLLIEPTGLGHPKEVLETLMQPHYQSVLDIQATISLVDARNIRDSRYTSNETFNEQLAVADIIVANKIDLYHADDTTLLIEYCQQFSNQRESDNLFFVENAHLDWQWLSYDNQFSQQQKSQQKLMPSAALQPRNFVTKQTATQLSAEILAIDEYVMKENQQDDFYSIGWRFGVGFAFSRLQLSVMLMGIDAERVKGIFITDEGVFGYNKTAYGLTEIPLDETMDSRLEIIIQNADGDVHASNKFATYKTDWQKQLLSARVYV